VLVDEHDAPVGIAPKLDVHHDGRLHRAVSVVLFDDAGRVLLQRRAMSKYHSAGLWSNTCCGHPTPGESVIDAAHRRLRGEMGIVGCDLRDVGSFIYREETTEGLIEHELDHVVVGTWTGEPQPDAREVAAWRWVTLERLTSDLATNARWYTVWLERVLAIARDHS
jgi:isopentenyl-diphosphate Delta-isomerase